MLTISNVHIHLTPGTKINIKSYINGHATRSVLGRIQP